MSTSAGTEKFDLFVSYSHAHSPTVGRIVRRLHEYGIDCFLDNWALRGGDEVGAAVHRSLSNSAAAVVFVSRESLASHWCRTEVEWICTQRWSDPQFRILPVRLDTTPLPPALEHTLAYQLAEPTDPAIIGLVNWIAKAIEKLSPGIFGRTGVLTDRVIHRVSSVIAALDLHRSHPKLDEIVALMSRSGCSIRDAGTCACGGVTLCGFVDVGMVDWSSNFFHLCPDCLKHGHAEVSCGATQENGSERMCPWCEPLWIW